MLNSSLTVVELTMEDAALFIEFQKRYSFIQLLNSLGVFDLKSASVTINFDVYGQIGSVEKREHFKLPPKHI